MTHSQEQPPAPLTLPEARALAAGLLLASSKLVLVAERSSLAAHAAWQTPLVWCQEALLALLLGAAVIRGGALAYALAGVVVFLNAVLTVVARATYAYYAPSDIMPEAGQWWQVCADYVDPLSGGLLALTAAGLLALPRWLTRRGGGALRALRAPVTRRGARSLALYGALGLALFSRPQLSAFRVHRNPMTFYLSELIAPTRLMSAGARPATLEELTEELGALSPQADHPPALSAERRAALPPSNVLLVVLESIGQRALRPLPDGSSNHPFLDSITPRALVFDAHHSPIPNSGAALDNIHCGALRPPKVEGGRPIQECLPFPARLSAAGVATGFFQSTFFGDWIPERFFQALGYEEIYDSRAVAARAQERGAPITLSREVAQERDTVEEVISWARGQCAAARPFLATWYSWVAHSPYAASHAGGQPVDPGASDELRYRQLVRVLDHELGRLHGALSALDCGGRPLTLVVTGDHGEAFLEHPGNRYHAAYTFQENLHVPLYVLTPQGYGGRVGRPSSHVDLARTLLALALGVEEGRRAAEVSPALQGSSLLEATRVEPIFSYSMVGSGMLAARFGQHKLIKSRDVTLLFDLRADPAELHSVAGELPALTAALSGAAERFIVGRGAAGR